jgi:hypothetical protein
MNIISLVLGDWSHDGHSQSDTVVISSNLDKNEMEKAYKKATKKLGFDFCDTVCADYEDNNLSEENLMILVNHGLKIDDLDLYNYDPKIDGDVHIWHDAFTHIYLFIIKLGNPNFEYKILEDDLNPSIHIGGYGLYQ